MKNIILKVILREKVGRGIEISLAVFFVLVIISISSCKKDKYTTIVEGTVINVGTQLPIAGVTVVIENEVSFTPSHLDSTVTDVNGNFHIELPDENGAWVYLKKSGYTFHSSSLNNVVGYLTSYSAGTTSGVKLEMYPKAWFNGKFLSTDSSVDDTLYFNPLTYFGLVNYGGGGLLRTGIGPHKAFAGNNGSLIRGDLYFRFGINYTKNGVWYVKVDSVYVGAFETFTDTIYY